MTYMDQKTAREVAKRIGGIAVSARKQKNGRWLIGSWHHADDVWIVVNIDKTAVLVDQVPKAK